MPPHPFYYCYTHGVRQAGRSVSSLCRTTRLVLALSWCPMLLAYKCQHMDPHLPIAPPPPRWRTAHAVQAPSYLVQTLYAHIVKRYYSDVGSAVLHHRLHSIGP